MTGETTGTVSGSTSPPDDSIDVEMKEELMALGRITHAMESFAGLASMEMQRWARNLNTLSETHKSLLEFGTIYSVENSALIEAVHHNDMFLRSMLEWLSEEQGPFPLHKCLEASEMWRVEHDSRVSAADFEKVIYVLKNIARDWSVEYSEEREASYGCICRALEEAFPRGDEEEEEEGQIPRVLIPGSGLGRLCVDIASRGFDASGNEHSYFMLLTTAYFLNGLVTQDQWTIYPWVLQTSNMRSFKDQIRPISFPDIVPYDVMSMSRGSLSMLAGDFVEVFSSEDFKEYYNAVVTCFFLDTAHNVIEYMEILWDVLEPGGIWIHFGPLQWHWADAHTYLSEEEISIEVPLDKVVEIAKNIGFVFDDDDDDGMKDGIPCPYMSTIHGMRPQVYDCAFWKARKPNQE